MMACYLPGAEDDQVEGEALMMEMSLAIEGACGEEKLIEGKPEI